MGCWLVGWLMLNQGELQMVFMAFKFIITTIMFRVPFPFGVWLSGIKAIFAYVRQLQHMLAHNAKCVRKRVVFLKLKDVSQLGWDIRKDTLLSYVGHNVVAVWYIRISISKFVVSNAEIILDWRLCNVINFMFLIVLTKIL